ncbi:unnamed protein product [Polarella glacialis]|uniref:Uncharacterized protein n=1 Tax=Polarella glacialis TaxID=89957 RepID=A0A813F8H5_POLGL|nr:unnamed protein product [Polarella glacialis]
MGKTIASGDQTAQCKTIASGDQKVQLALFLRQQGGHAKLSSVLAKAKSLQLTGVTSASLKKDFVVERNHVALRPFQQTIACLLRRSGSLPCAGFLKRPRWTGVVDKAFLQQHFAVKKGRLLLKEDRCWCWCCCCCWCCFS